ncbi:MAG TPA: zinc-binding dehydrogenase [Anaerolineae bacterium]|nr:zinc-binding dehydrogenase [Anaerolineae bacterium]
MSVEIMRRAVIVGPRQVEIQESPLPALAPDDVLVRVRHSALCTFEQRAYSGADTRFYPLLGGHEMAGVVEAMGAQVLNVKVGDKVAIWAIDRCGSCYSCRRGQACDNVWFKRAGAEKPKGPTGPAGLATHKLAKEYQVFKLAPGTDLLEASLTEPLACVLRSVNKADVKAGDTVVVVGGGVMGLLHTMLARGRGAQVIVSEPHAQRRQDSARFGAQHAIDPINENFAEQVKAFTNGRGADVVIVATSAVPALQSAFGAVCKGGRMMVYARMEPKGATISVDPNLFHDSEIVLSGTISTSPEEFQQAAEIVSTHALDLRSIISVTYPLDEIQPAFEASMDLGTYRVVVNT